jgi:hypothetical protein
VRALLCALSITFSAPAAFGEHGLDVRGYDARGHWFDLSSERGRAVALTFGSRKTENEVRTVNQTLARHTGPTALLVTVVDLRDVPHFAHGLAMNQIRQSDRPGRVHHLVDKRGEIARGFGIDPRQAVDIFIVDKRGRVAGHFVGKEQLTQAEARLSKVERESVAARSSHRRGRR